MAVNIAARLCAIAAPGEVVVSDTVRALTRSVGTAAFVPLGRRRLKGLDEPIMLYRAVPAGTATDRGPRAHRVSRRLALVSVGLLLAGLAVAGFAVPRLMAPGATPMATEQRPANLFSTSTVEACEAREECEMPFAAPFSISLGSTWLLRAELTDWVLFEHRAEPAGFIEAMLVVAALDPPCDTSTPQFIGEDPADVIDWLSSRPWLDHGDPRPYNVGGYLGRSVDIEVLPADNWTCPEPNEEADVKIFQLGAARGSMEPGHFEFGRSWPASVGEQFRMIAIEVGGRTVTLSVGRPHDANSFWLLSEPLLQTIEFEESVP